MFIRFIAGEDCDNPLWATGVIATSRLLIDEGRLDEWAVESVQDIFD